MSSSRLESTPWWQALLERDAVPDPIIRSAVRRLLATRLREEMEPDRERAAAAKRTFVERLADSPIAIRPDAANEQHYEVPAEFFRMVLGKRMKYSCGLWGEGARTLDDAELSMLALTAERAGIRDGDRILDLGCGWGSLTLYLAERFPSSSITGVSNSASQRELVESAARERGLTNVTVLTADMNDFEPTGRFDRVVSVEMFEHMRNWPRLLSRVRSWMNESATLFVHVFAHRELAYAFEDRDASDWMARHFFTGGMMPSDDLMLRCQRDLALREHWAVSGLHYQRTCDAWLSNFDAHRGEILGLFGSVYGHSAALRWAVRWRVFFIACSELFGYRHGNEWHVSHYLLDRRG